MRNSQAVMEETILENTPESEVVSHTKIVELVRKWGDLNTDGVLDPVCQIFIHPSIEGLIAYRVASGNAVVYGEPLCSSENKGRLATFFQSFCQKKHWKVVYTIVSEKFAEWSAVNLSGVTIQFGEKLILNPMTSHPSKKTGSKAVLLRQKIKHAAKGGVVSRTCCGCLNP